MNSGFASWSDVRVFLAVMRAGSTLAASRSLGIAQPTVARRIDALESKLGLTLFLRDTRGFSPTDCANALLPAAEALEAAAAAFAAQSEQLARPRPIRITAFEPNLAFPVQDIFSEFSLRHPEVQLEFLSTVKPLDLMGGEADVALRLTWSTPHPDLICRHISTAQFTVYAAPDYAKAHGLPHRPEDLRAHRVFTFRRHDVPTKMHDWLLRYVPADGFARTFSEVSLMDAAIRAGQGVGLMNVRKSMPEEEAGTLVRCFAPPEELDMPHMVLISPQAHRRREVRAFAKFFLPRYARIFR